MLPKAHLNGRRAEQQAAEYLAAQGLTLVDRNYRKKIGEIDIIARQNDLWICVEVKYRQSNDHGSAVEMVSRTKLSRMIAAFNLYLMDNKLNPAHTQMRFDIIAIDNDELIWFKNVTL